MALLQATVVTKKKEGVGHQPMLQFDPNLSPPTARAVELRSAEGKLLLRIAVGRIINVALGGGAESGNPYSITFQPSGEDDPKELCCAKFASAHPAGDVALLALFRALEAAVYPDGPRRIIAFVSPISGEGKGVQLWAKYGIPLISMSRHTLLSITTTHRFHALEYCRDPANELRPTDVVVAVGGDGMLWEVVNGLKQRQAANPSAIVGASALPSVAVFATGSGCAMAQGMDVIRHTDAVLAAMHNVTVPIDLMVVRQAPTVKLATPDKSTASPLDDPKALPGAAIPVDPAATPIWSFLSIATSFIAEIDRESEKWRWMGNARFAAYAVKKLLSGVPCYRATVKYVPWRGAVEPSSVGFHDWGERGAASPKTLKDLPTTRCTLSAACECHRFSPKDGSDAPRATTPTATATTAADEWIEIPTHKFALLTLCRFGYLARDNLMAPFCHVADGAMDLTFAPASASRFQMAQALLQMEKGTHVEEKEPVVQYIKASKVLIEPFEGYVMVDGEHVDFHGYVAEMEKAGIRLVRSSTRGGHKYPS